MSQPPAYTRQFGFTSFQLVNPAEPLPSAQFEIEFNAIKATLDAVLNNMAQIQRDDGNLANLSVGNDQLEVALRTGINLPTVWTVAPTVYSVNDTVVYFAGGRSELWVALIAHTSTSDFDTDSLVSFYWRKLGDFSTLALTAAQTTYDNASSELSATDVQAAIDEINVEIVGRGLDTRALTELADIAASVNFIRTAGYFTIGDGGEGLYKRALTQPSHNLKIQSADGAWWELIPVNGVISFQACGGVQSTDPADGVANVAAFDTFIGYAQTFFSSTPNAAGPTLYFPKGDYHFSDHLNVKAQVKIIGDGSWGEIKRGARLHFVAGSNGIIVQGSITMDEITVSSGFTGHGTEIDGLHFIGNGFGDTTGHGIWLRAQALVRNCFVEQFGLDGVHIVAHIGAGGETEGNANQWRVEGVNTRFNGRHGLYVDGNDVNAGYGIGVDANNNGRWGINDSSFLGNTYLGSHTSANGLANLAGNASDSSSLVSFGGNVYEANMDASEADLVATEPGTDLAVWIFRVAGSPSSPVPLWVAAKPEGTYFHGGSFTVGLGHAGNYSVVVGGYVEGNQCNPQIFPPAMIVGGLMNKNNAHGYALLGTPTGAVISGQIAFDNKATFRALQSRQLELNVNIAPEKLLRVRSDTNEWISLAAWDEGADNYVIFEANNGASSRPLLVTSGSTLSKGGRVAALAAGHMIMPRGIFLGPSVGNSRRLANATAGATTGDRAQGEFDFNRSPAAGAPAGWHCTTGHASAPTFTALYGVGTQQSNIVDADTSHALNATFSDTEVEAALNVLATKINSLIAATEHFGFTAP